MEKKTEDILEGIDPELVEVLQGLKNSDNPDILNVKCISIGKKDERRNKRIDGKFAKYADENIAEDSNEVIFEMEGQIKLVYNKGEGIEVENGDNKETYQEFLRNIL